MAYIYLFIYLSCQHQIIPESIQMGAYCPKKNTVEEYTHKNKSEPIIFVHTSIISLSLGAFTAISDRRGISCCRTKSKGWGSPLTTWNEMWKISFCYQFFLLTEKRQIKHSTGQHSPICHSVTKNLQVTVKSGMYVVAVHGWNAHLLFQWWLRTYNTKTGGRCEIWVTSSTTQVSTFIYWFIHQPEKMTSWMGCVLAA